MTIKVSPKKSPKRSLHEFQTFYNMTLFILLNTRIVRNSDPNCILEISLKDLNFEKRVLQICHILKLSLKDLNFGSGSMKRFLQICHSIDWSIAVCDVDTVTSSDFGAKSTRHGTTCPGCPRDPLRF